MISRLDINNFTVFEKATIEFSPKINVIIGENGSGKTHLLKMIFALFSACRQNGVDAPEKDIVKKWTDIFSTVFRPLDDKVGKLYRHKASGPASLKLHDIHNGTFSIGLSSARAATLSLNGSASSVPTTFALRPVFIPAKEVLSFMKGFAGLYESYRLSFDETYRSICSLLESPERAPGKLSKKSQWAIKRINEICGGKFIAHAGGVFTFKANDSSEFSANCMAEGFRKFGILLRLLETGAIAPGKGGPLLWDEPEGNLNPQLMKVLVEILLELSRSGQQVVLATHDYVLLKWFDLLQEKMKEDFVMYHTLTRSESGGFEIQSSADYNLLDKFANNFL